MKQMKQIKCRNAERGNVLFLILIAVALFAALSYAVTSSSRSSGGDADQETNLISGSTITQYPSAVRTAMLRMQISNGVAADEFEFNAPVDSASCFTVAGTVGVNCVFHPDGGGAAYTQGPADSMVSGTQTPWVFNSENEVNLIGRTGGSDTPTVVTADVTAFLVGIRNGICRRINEELGIPGIPADTGIDFTTQMENSDGTLANIPGIGAGGGTIGEATTGTSANLDGQAFGCFSQGGSNVYYHLLVEQ